MVCSKNIFNILFSNENIFSNDIIYFLLSFNIIMSDFPENLGIPNKFIVIIFL